MNIAGVADDCPGVNKYAVINYDCQVLTPAQVTFFTNQYNFICSLFNSLTTTTNNLSSFFTALANELDRWIYQLKKYKHQSNIDRY